MKVKDVPPGDLVKYLGVVYKVNFSQGRFYLCGDIGTEDQHIPPDTEVQFHMSSRMFD